MIFRAQIVNFTFKIGIKIAQNILILPDYQLYNPLGSKIWLGLAQKQFRAKVLHNTKILFGIVGGICILAVEFNGLVSKQNRPVSTGWFIFL